MLSGNFFHIKSLDSPKGEINALLEINAAHPIFKGHFPGQPVVPGVCMMQMVKEVLEKVLDKKIRLASADNIKFLTVLDPLNTVSVQATIKYNIAVDGALKIAASLIKDASLYFKMNGIYIFMENEPD